MQTPYVQYKNYLCILAMLVLGGGALQAQSARPGDSLTLVAMYNSLGGENWERNEGWLSPLPISQWHGVTTETILEDGTPTVVVIRINLGGNNLAGELFDFNLPDLRELNLSGNQLVGTIPNFTLPKAELLNLLINDLRGAVPDFDKMPDINLIFLSFNDLTSLPLLTSKDNLEFFWIEGNKLTFEDIEPNIERGLIDFRYFAQDTTLPLLVEAVNKNLAVLTVVPGGGASNLFQWKRNGQSIKGANDAVYQATQPGQYFCAVSNSLAEKLLLMSDTVTLDVGVNVAENFRFTEPKVQLQVAPNPSLTTPPVLYYELATAGIVSMRLVNSSGQMVETIFNHRFHQAGKHSIPLAAVGLAAGVYWIQLEFQGRLHTTKYIVPGR